MRVQAMYCIAILFLFSQRVNGDEVWSWHAFDAKVLKTSRVEITAHSRFRTDRHFGNVQQGRAGAIARVFAPGKSAVLTGYYYGKEEDSAEDWRNFHRVFGGLEAPLFRAGRVAVATRGILERFIGTDRPGFTRYRHRVRADTRAPIGPYMASEWFFDANGWLSGRYAAGVRWRCNAWSSVEMGYLYDTIIAAHRSASRAM